MYYFLDDNFNQFASGIEHAVLKRQHLFKANREHAKIVSINYSTRIVNQRRYWNIDSDEFINMYDYFAESGELPESRVTVEDLGFRPPLYRLEEHGAQVGVFIEQRRVADIHLFTDELGGVDRVDFFDDNALRIRTDYYDTRGYRSMSQYFAHADNQAVFWVVVEQFYTVDGRVFLENHYVQDVNGSGRRNGMQLTLKNRPPIYLQNVEQLFRRFFEIIAAETQEPVAFIADRQDDIAHAMIFARVHAAKILYVHSLHYSPYTDPVHGGLTFRELAQTDQLSRLDVIITSTTRQATDLQARLHTQIPVVGVPVGIVPAALLAQTPIPIDAPGRIRGKVVVVARLYWEKNVSDAIRAFAIAHEQLDWLTMDIYGYGDDRDQHQEQKQLHQLVADMDLDDVVTFKGHTNNMNAVYDGAQLSLLTSKLEGFALALLEAESHGVPVISYDINYGPAEIVEDGRSGFLVPPDDFKQMAARMLQLFSNPQRLAEFSRGAYAASTKFSAGNVWRQWQGKVFPVAGKGADQ